MSSIEAIYQGGAFKPVGPVDLPDNQRVRLHVEPIPPVRPEEVRAWLERLRQFHADIVARHGYLPDSTPDIAEDRRRDG
jgi:predicted DNA-binding antitoxin AbrB/MazE fold protein